MAIDLKQTDSTRDLELPMAVGEVFDEEGQLVIQTLTSGEEQAVRGTAAGSLRLLGFAKLDTVSPASTRAYTTTGVIPSSAPYTIDIGHTLVTSDINANGDIRVQRVDTGAYLTLAAGAPATGEFQLSGGAAGIITLHADQAGLQVRIFARVTMTAREATGLYQQRHINSNAQADLQRVGIISGTGTIYTDQFDQSVTDWTAGDLRTGAAGVITVGGGGTVLDAELSVIHVPTVDSPSLGLRFNLGG